MDRNVFRDVNEAIVFVLTEAQVLFKKRADAPVSDADLRLCFELLDARYNARLPTILSCELTFEELVALDEAIAGRIREMCGPFLVSVDRDMRKDYRFRAP